MKNKWFLFLLIPVKFGLMTWLITRYRYPFVDKTFELGLSAWFLLALLMWIGRKTISRFANVLGILFFLLLFLPSAQILKQLPWYFWSEQLITPANFLELIIISSALIVAGFLLYASLNEAEQDGRRKRVKPVPVIISGVILIKVFYDFYWFMVWDSTYDALSFIWLPIPLLAVMFSSLMLAVTLPGWRKSASLAFGLVVSILLSVYIVAQLVDFRQLTDNRAERLSQAVEAYYSRERHYPEDLSQLTPRYTLTLREPVIIYPQEWCYEGGFDYYTLGYVNRDHWSDPRLYGKISASAGDVPQGTGLCEAEIFTLKARYPIFSYEYGVNNK